MGFTPVMVRSKLVTGFITMMEMEEMRWIMVGQWHDTRIVYTQKPLKTPEKEQRQAIHSRNLEH